MTGGLGLTLRLFMAATRERSLYFLHYIHLTKQRTHELWDAYLTFADSTRHDCPSHHP